MEKFEELIKTGTATIIDVRKPSEYAAGHAAGSINIPLRSLPEHLHELRAMKNIVVCCASGIRSAQAKEFLNQHGIECADAGGWINLNNNFCNC